MTFAKKDETVNLRMDKDTRDIISRAAAITGKSLTSFMTEAAYQSAQKELLDQRFLTVDADVFDAIEIMLSEPGKMHPKLVEVLKSEMNWLD